MTKEKAIKELEELRDEWSRHIYSEGISKRVSLDMAIEAIKTLKQESRTWSLVREDFIKKEPRWIPCSESLPEKDDEYLCTVANIEEGFPNYLKLCDYYNEIHKFEVNEYDGEVLAWYSEPLPKPYIAGSKDKEVSTNNDTATFWDR